MNDREFQRFTKYVQIPDENGCLNWIGAKDRRQYGFFCLKGRTTDSKQITRRAYRLAYEHFIGPIPAGLTIDHLCKNHSCVNPTHLEVVTQKINILRGESFAAKRARQTHCKHGHEFTPENTGHKRTGRYCRQCNYEWQRQHNWGRPERG